MKKYLIVLGLIGAFSQSCEAQTIVWKKVNPARLQGELKGAGFNVGSILCQAQPSGNHRCEILWGKGGESKDPKAVIDAHVYRDFDEERRLAIAEVRFLSVRLKSRAITSSEKDRLLELMVELMFGGDVAVER